jgi:hypothetical protein
MPHVYHVLEGPLIRLSNCIQLLRDNVGFETPPQVSVQGSSFTCLVTLSSPQTVEAMQTIIDDVQITVY